MSEAILVLMILLMILTIFCLYKMYDKRGLYFSLVIINLISFIFAFKIATILKLNINMSIISFTGMITILNMFVLKYGIQERKNLIKLTLYSNIITALLLLIMNFFVPAITETISINMQGTFEYNYKILIVYPITTLISQILSIKLFNIVNQIQPSIFISGIITYIMTALIYTVIFSLLIYINIMEIKYTLFVGISTYILGLIVMIINTLILNTIYKKKVI